MRKTEWSKCKLPVSTEKKKESLQPILRVRFYSVGMLEDSNPKSAYSEEAGEEPGYIQVCSKGAGSLNIKNY